MTEALYWDASAVFSLIFPDKHSSAAKAYAAQSIAHLTSSLAFAEVHAALERAQRNQVHSAAILAAGLKRLEEGSWEHVRAAPSRAILRELAPKFALNGADLWHLALAKTLNAERPRLRLLSFDARLAAAAAAEGFAASETAQ